MDSAFSDLTGNPSIAETFVDVLLCAVPIWLAATIGLLIGWSWRPRWTGLAFLGLRSKLRLLWTAPPGFGARRLWLAFTALSAFSVFRTVWSRGKRGKSVATEGSPASQREGDDDSSSSRVSQEGEGIVTENDLDHLLHVLEGKDMEWQPVMGRSTSNMAYQAWRHESQTHPTIYRSRTVYEDATPELVRDFFWDDDFRLKWDPMLVYFKILEEFPHTGTMIVHWIKKFPFFCSDREYIIGRRIWEAGKTYYCVTKGVPYPGLPKRDKPRRVELYFSSWVIRPVKSRKGDGQMSACEVTLLHYEDMGIPKDVAKLGVRHGMWGTVKKIHSGLRSYQNIRKNQPSVSRCVLMARITTKISLSPQFSESELVNQEEDGDQVVDIERDNNLRVDWKWIVVSMSVTIICGLRSEEIAKGALGGTWPRIARR